MTVTGLALFYIKGAKVWNGVTVQALSLNTNSSAYKYVTCSTVLNIFLLHTSFGHVFDEMRNYYTVCR